jgi:hypothetical protein
MLFNELLCSACNSSLVLLMGARAEAAAPTPQAHEKAGTHARPPHQRAVPRQRIPRCVPVRKRRFSHMTRDGIRRFTAQLGCPALSGHATAAPLDFLRLI